MSGSHPSGGSDPSMDDILASIRRILNEDETPPQVAARASGGPPAAASEVFALDASMLVPESGPKSEPAAKPEPMQKPEPPPPAPARSVAVRAEPERIEPVLMEPRVVDEPEPLRAVEAAPAVPLIAGEPLTGGRAASLVAPEAAAAAAQSVGSLRRTLEAGKASLAVRNGGPTLDDIVREELRPILKAWLDANLPPMVERLVRAEIERVIGRADL